MAHIKADLKRGHHLFWFQARILFQITKVLARRLGVAQVSSIAHMKLHLGLSLLDPRQVSRPASEDISVGDWSREI